jgi:hypothetical protein
LENKIVHGNSRHAKLEANHNITSAYVVFVYKKQLKNSSSFNL